MADRKGATVAGGCVWCGGSHDSLDCPIETGSPTQAAAKEFVRGTTAAGDVHRLNAKERATVYGVIGRMARRRGESGFDDEIPLHRRVMICGVSPDQLERACDPGPGGGVNAITISEIREVLGRWAIA